MTGFKKGAFPDLSLLFIFVFSTNSQGSFTLVRIPQWTVAICREIGNFLSLRWHSLLRKAQTAVASVNQPLTVKNCSIKVACDWIRTRVLLVTGSDSAANFSQPPSVLSSFDVRQKLAKEGHHKRQIFYWTINYDDDDDERAHKLISMNLLSRRGGTDESKLKLLKIKLIK